MQHTDACRPGDAGRHADTDARLAREQGQLMTALREVPSGRHVIERQVAVADNERLLSGCSPELRNALVEPLVLRLRQLRAVQQAELDLGRAALAVASRITSATPDGSYPGPFRGAGHPPCGAEAVRRALSVLGEARDTLSELHVCAHSAFADQLTALASAVDRHDHAAIRAVVREQRATLDRIRRGHVARFLVPDQPGDGDPAAGTGPAPVAAADLPAATDLAAASAAAFAFAGNTLTWQVLQRRLAVARALLEGARTGYQEQVRRRNEQPVAAVVGELLGGVALPTPVDLQTARCDVALVGDHLAGGNLPAAAVAIEAAERSVIAVADAVDRYRQCAVLDSGLAAAGRVVLSVGTQRLIADGVARARELGLGLCDRIDRVRTGPDATVGIVLGGFGVELARRIQDQPGARMLAGVPAGQARRILAESLLGEATGAVRLAVTALDESRTVGCDPTVDETIDGIARSVLEPAGRFVRLLRAGAASPGPASPGPASAGAGPDATAGSA